MKKLYLILIFVFAFAAASCLSIAAVQSDKIFYNSEEYQKIINNKSHIIKVMKYSSPEGGFIQEEINIEKALKKVENLKNIKKTNIAVADADWHYVFEFDDNSTVNIYFEGQFLHYKGQNYEILK